MEVGYAKTLACDRGDNVNYRLGRFDAGKLMTLPMLNHKAQFIAFVQLKLTHGALTLILVLPGTGCNRPIIDNDLGFDLAKTRAENTNWSTFVPTGGPSLRCRPARAVRKLVGVRSGSPSDRR